MSKKAATPELRNIEEFLANSTPYTPPETLSDKLVDSMGKRRARMLSNMTDPQLIHEINDYFQKNKTMPGEKNLRVAATQCKEIMDQLQGLCEAWGSSLDPYFITGGELHSHIVTDRTDPEYNLRDMLKDEYTKVCIKQATVNLDTVPSGLVKQGDNTYSFPVGISDTTILDTLTDDAEPTPIGTIKDQFLKNHDIQGSHQGHLIIVDNTGKMDKQNLTVRLLIDLGEEYIENAKALSQEKLEEESWAEDFADSVNKLSVPEDAPTQ